MDLNSCLMVAAAAVLKKGLYPTIRVGFTGGARVKNLPANAGDLEAQFQSLGWENYLERGMATHSILAWSITRTEEPGRLWSIGLKSWIRLN